MVFMGELILLKIEKTKKLKHPWANIQDSVKPPFFTTWGFPEN